MNTHITTITLLFITVFTILAISDLPQTGERLEEATFAGGCFWCIEAAFQELDGVKEAISGYTGGKKENPTYKEVSAGLTGHIEAVRVVYDPQKISYGELLNFFWRQFDPTDAGGSFVDRGTQYTSAIFYHNREQKLLAEASKQKIAASGVFNKAIVTPIRPAGKFYPAEEYHQDYYKTNSLHYKAYRAGSGRDQFIERVWGKRNNVYPSKPLPSQKELKKRLTQLQFQVTQNAATEPPFRNEYWDNKRDGIYVDVVSGEPLFSSPDKFTSGTGWPSFTRPLEPLNIVEYIDRTMGMELIELKSRRGKSHLGHVFQDGPPPTGLRYCINSAALRFVPKEELEKEGYGEYLTLFEEK